MLDPLLRKRLRMLGKKGGRANTDKQRAARLANLKKKDKP